ncbi:MAG: hypothetical protein WDN49_16870 [Acetobacteraceae bacterium]
MKTYLSAALALGLGLAGSTAFAQTATPPTRLRGTIEKLTGNDLVMKTRTGQEVTVKLTDSTAIAGVFQAQLADIKPGSFIGSAAAPQPDGSLKAIEVTVFPPGMHGGEGHYAWDLTPTSTMTNGTVGNLTVSNGRTMTVQYPNGQKTIFVPTDVPIVSFEVSDRSKLVAGAHVIVTETKAADGTVTANRVQVGENGVIPPS